MEFPDDGAVDPLGAGGAEAAVDPTAVQSQVIRRSVVLPDPRFAKRDEDKSTSESDGEEEVDKESEVRGAEIEKMLQTL